MEDINIGGLYISSWALGMAVVVVWLLVLVPAKIVVFQLIRRRLPREPLSWGQVLIHAVSAPVTLLILAGAFAIAEVLVPMSPTAGRIISVAALLLAAIAVALTADFLVLGVIRRAEHKNEHFRAYSTLARAVTHGLIIFLGTLVVLGSLGISIAPLVVALAVAAVAVALALQDTLRNLCSGVYVLMDKPIKVGQYVEIEGGIQGFVDQTDWRSTRIRTLANNIVVVPNSKIAGSVISSYDMPEGEIGVLIPIGVHYKSDLDQVEKITVEVAREVLEAIEGSPPRVDPYIRYHAFGESAINFTVVLCSRNYNARHLITHEFIKRLHKRYREQGIVIPPPTHTLYLTQE
jgi:small-conductance mechanosensitive channel